MNGFYGFCRSIALSHPAIDVTIRGIGIFSSLVLIFGSLLKDSHWLWFALGLGLLGAQLAFWVGTRAEAGD